MRRFILRLVNVFRHGRAEDELAREVRAHLAIIEVEYRRQGLSESDARLAARRAMNGVEQTKEHQRDARSLRWLEDLGRDLRHALRMMRRDKAWTAVVVVSLALGIGANTAIYGALNGLLVAKVPVADPDSLVRLRSAGPNQMRTSSSDYGFSAPSQGRSVRATFSYPMYLQFRQDNRAMADLAAGAPADRLTAIVNGEAAIARGFVASGNYFQVLGVDAAIGRTIVPDDDRPDAAPVAVISHAYWQSRFGGDPAVVGRTFRLNDAVVTIVGVLGASFTGIQRPASAAPDVTVPLSATRALGLANAPLDRPTSWWLQVFGRLRPGATAGQVEGNLGGVFQATARAGLDQYLAGLTDEQRDRAFNQNRTDVPALIVDSAAHGVYDVETDAMRAGTILAAVVGLVLLLVCANVANLLLSRSTARQKELAVRQSLGAARGRLARQLLTESLLLALLGGGLGVALGYWSRLLLPAWLGRAAVEGQVFVFDWRVFAFLAAITILAGLIFGLVPALRASCSLDAELKAAGRSVAGGRSRLASALLVLQVAISLVLLVGAGLFLRTVINLRGVDVGFDPDKVVLFRVDPIANTDNDARLRVYQSIAERVGALPGVRAVGLSNVAMLTGFENTSNLYIEGGSATDGAATDRVVASPGFFDALRIPLAAGRGFSVRDDGNAPKVALVNQALVREAFGGENPIGRRFGTSQEGRGDIEIVGVVGDAKYTSVRDAAPPTIYVPHGQATMPRAVFEVRTGVDPLSIVPSLREAVREVDPNLPVTDVSTQAAEIEGRFVQERVFSQVCSLFGALAAIVAAIGLFGLMSYSVARRTNEIGIRMTLGAQPTSVLRLVLRESFVLVAIGIGVGLVAAMGAARLVASQLYGLAPTDLVTIAGASLLMLVVSAIAGYLPARRASKVDPMIALRCE